MKRKALEYLLVVLILSPLLMINIRNSHDWGDDFAGYIMEARNIAEGKPFYETKMVPQDYMPSYAPQYYSYGFPLLLSPVIKVFGVNFKALDMYMSLWLVLWGVLVFYYLRSRFSFFTSASFILIFFINPFFFRFKTEILSDIPFSFFFTLAMLLFITRRTLSLVSQVLFGLVIAFTIGVRGLGYFFPVLLIVDLFLGACYVLLKVIPRGEFLTSAKGAMITLVSSAAGIFIMSGILFKAPASQLGHFAGLYHSPSYWDTFIFNLDVYTRLFQALFRHDAGKYTFALYYSTAFMLVLTVLGFVHLLFTRHRWELLLLIAYGFVVLLFPFASQGFRYLLPVLPIMMVCAIYGAKSITLPASLSKYVAGGAFVLFMCLINLKDIRAAKTNEGNAIWPGPMTWESAEVLDYIKTRLPKDALIATIKPRAVMLFTDRRTCLIPKNATVAFAASELESVHPDYLLHLQDMQVNVVNDLAALEQDSLIWEQNGNKIYKCRKD